MAHQNGLRTQGRGQLRRIVPRMAGEHEIGSGRQHLKTLGLQLPKRAGRPWSERRRGALKLLRKQAWLLGAQALLTLGVILASPWLPFAG